MKTPIHLPLAGAYLCSNCNHVGNSSTVCPSCSDSTSLLNLSTILDRVPPRPYRSAAFSRIEG